MYLVGSDCGINNIQVWLEIIIVQLILNFRF